MNRIVCRILDRLLNVTVMLLQYFAKLNRSFLAIPNTLNVFHDRRSWTAAFELLSTRTVMHVPIEDREKERTNIYSQWANCLFIIFSLFVLHHPIFEIPNTILSANLILEFACTV